MYLRTSAGKDEFIYFIIVALWWKIEIFLLIFFSLNYLFILLTQLHKSAEWLSTLRIWYLVFCCSLNVQQIFINNMTFTYE